VDTILIIIAATIIGVFAADKIHSIFLFLTRKSEYEILLRQHKQYINDITAGLKNNKSETPEILFDKEKVMGDLNSLKRAYSYLDVGDGKGEIKVKFTVNNIEKDYKLMSRYLKYNVMQRSSSVTGLALNYGLINSLLYNFLSATDNSAINRSTIVGMLVGKKMKEDTRSYIYLFFALAAHLGASLLGVVEFNMYIVSFLILMIAALAINQKALEYRIKYGLYGSTPYEVREIIRFIDEHTDKSDFNDPEGKKKIFQDALEEAPKEVIVNGGAYQ
jgi:hypothetical protein